MPRKTLTSSRLLFTALAICRERAGGATLTVCASGCNHSAIQDAVTASDVGDSIEIAGETFYESDIEVDLDQRLALIGDGSADTIINATGGTHGIYVRGGSSGPRSLNVTGLTVMNANSHGIHVYRSIGTSLIVDDVELNDVVLRDNGGRGMEIHNDNVVNGLRIVDCEFMDNAEQGLRTASNVVVNGMTIENSKFNGNTYGIYLQGTIDGLTIRGSEFSDSVGGYGGYMTETGPLTNALIEDSVFDNNVVGLMIWNRQDNSNIEVNRCVFSNNNKRGLLIWGSSLTDVLVQESTVKDNDISGQGYWGIDFYTYDDSMDSVVVRQTNITGHTVGGGVMNQHDPTINNGTSIVDATLNWWGSADGPAGSGFGSGDDVTDNVEFCPWLDDVAGSGDLAYHPDCEVCQRECQCGKRSKSKSGTSDGILVCQIGSKSRKGTKVSRKMKSEESNRSKGHSGKGRNLTLCIKPDDLQDHLLEGHRCGAC